MHTRFLRIHIFIDAHTSFDMATEPNGKLAVAIDKTKFVESLVERLTSGGRENVGQEEKFIASLDMEDLKFHINQKYGGETLAHKAARNNWVVAMERLIELGADHLAECDMPGHPGKTVVQVALINNSTAVYNLMFDSRLFDSSLTDSEGSTLLHTAVSCESSLMMVESMVHGGADVFAKGIGGRTPIAYFGGPSTKVRRAEEIMKKILSSERRERKHPSIIVCAAEGGQFDLVRTLLRFEVSVDTQREDGCTALMTAVSGGHLDIVKAILEASPDLHIQDERGQTVLHYCVRSEKMEECMRLMFANLKGASVCNTPDKDGKTPLHVASEANSEVYVKLLLEYGAEAHIEDKHNKTPFDSATDPSVVEIIRSAYVSVNSLQMQINRLMTEGQPELAISLLEKTHLGEILSYRNSWGMGLSHIAAYRGWLEVIRWLVSNGADISVRDKKGRTPLHWAAGYGVLPAVELLVREGADCEARDEMGRTPFKLAVEARQVINWSCHRHYYLFGVIELLASLSPKDDIEDDLEDEEPISHAPPI
jgi:ankyrin repeat protein